jgi:beta-1,4-mannosyltransferase
MEVVFAPDWREGVPYQRLLAEALEKQGVRVHFLFGYKRLFPLARAMREKRADILHLHWPEAYYPPKKDGRDWFRRARFTLDLSMALRRCKLATTGHNLAPHNRSHEAFAVSNLAHAYRRSGVVFAHSEVAKKRMAGLFGLDEKRIAVIPHGDLSTTLGAPVSKSNARAALTLPPTGKIALIFGMVEPYKGQEELIEWWRTSQTDITLAIVGKPMNAEYRAHLLSRIGDAKNIIARLEWLPDDALRDWLCASDCVVFNYQQIFTSGAANLARSWGLPMLLPSRLDTVILDEPSPYIHRFDNINSSLAPALKAATAIAPDFEAAGQWREYTSWDRVASLTATGYRSVLG